MPTVFALWTWTRGWLWASCAAFTVGAFTAVQVKEFGAAAGLFLLAGLSLIVFSWGWRGINNYSTATKIIRTIFFVCGIVLTPLIVVWVDRVREDQPWSVFFKDAVESGKEILPQPVADLSRDEPIKEDDLKRRTVSLATEMQSFATFKIARRPPSPQLGELNGTPRQTNPQNLKMTRCASTQSVSGRECWRSTKNCYERGFGMTG